MTDKATDKYNSQNYRQSDSKTTDKATTKAQPSYR